MYIAQYHVDCLGQKAPSTPVDHSAWCLVARGLLNRKILLRWSFTEERSRSAVVVGEWPDGSRYATLQRG